MKKARLINLLLAMLLLLSIFVTGCVEEKEPVDTNPPEEKNDLTNDDKEGNSEGITEIIYESIVYHEGGTTSYKLNFTENKVYRKVYFNYSNSATLPEELLASDEYKNNGIYVEIKTFDEEAEKAFIAACASAGFFKLESVYDSREMDDGGGWELKIKYASGEVKSSVGINDCPESVFKACVEPFYIIVGEYVLDYVQYTRLLPPEISITAKTEDGASEINVKNSAIDFLWADGAFAGPSEHDAYEVNEIYSANKLNAELYKTVIFSTEKYHDYDEFSKFILKSYDYNAELTGETVLAEDGWFSELTFDLESNKIYVYELRFENGDFVIGTFNTKA